VGLGAPPPQGAELDPAAADDPQRTEISRIGSVTSSTLGRATAG
jgi:hypothetical protein